MLRIPKKHSVYLSMILSTGFLVLMSVFFILMKPFVWAYVDFRIPDAVMSDRIYILIIGYIIALIGIIAAVFLILLLRRVLKSMVFSERSVGLVRGISWCAILMGLSFLLLARYFTVAFLIAFAGIFLGVCVRVVKNVIEEATAIKAENDLTV